MRRGDRERGRAREQRLLVTGLLVVDVMALALAVSLAGLLRVGVESILPVAALGWPERHVVASLLVAPILVVLFWVQGRYDVHNALIGPREYALVAHAVTYGLIVTLAVSFFAGGEPLVSRSWLLLVWILAISLVSLGRFSVRHAVRRLRRRGILRTRVLIVGASSTGVALAEQFSAAEGEGIDVVGFLDEYVELGQILLPGIHVIGRPRELLNCLGEDDVDEVILVPQALPHERLDEITRLMVSRGGPIVRMALSSSELLTHSVLVTQRSSVPLVSVQRARITGLDVVLKRGLDLFGAATILVILSPLVLLALVRARVANRHPNSVLVRVRVYSGGRQTWLCLFDRAVNASMLVRGAPAALAVLTGQLSLVGPRPIRCDPPNSSPGLSVAAVKPGLTGQWRLSGPNSSLEEQALQDLTYVRNYSIWEDLRILWQTARGILCFAAGGPMLVRWETDRGLSERPFRVAWAGVETPDRDGQPALLRLLRDPGKADAARAARPP